MYLLQRMMTETIFPSIPRLPVMAVATPPHQKWSSWEYIVVKIYCCAGIKLYWWFTIMLGLFWFKIYCCKGICCRKDLWLRWEYIVVVASYCSGPLYLWFLRNCVYFCYLHIILWSLSMDVKYGMLFLSPFLFTVWIWLLWC